MIDIHSHILPGIDDGAKTLTDSVEIVRDLARFGVTDVIATPHYICETNYISPRGENLVLLGKLRQALADEGTDIRVYLGNELFIDNIIYDLLKKGKISTMAGSEYLLVELPLNEEFPNYEDIFLELMNNGYKVILAHPERYGIVQKDYEIVKNLYNQGVLLQCNLGSLIGKYGNGAKKTIKKLIRDKMIFAFGSDIHHLSRVDRSSQIKKKLAKYFSDEELKKILETNPKKLIKS